MPSKLCNSYSLILKQASLPADNCDTIVGVATAQTLASAGTPLIRPRRPDHGVQVEHCNVTSAPLTVWRSGCSFASSDALLNNRTATGCSFNNRNVRRLCCCHLQLQSQMSQNHAAQNGVAAGCPLLLLLLWCQGTRASSRSCQTNVNCNTCFA